jgi:hypothetical protein
MRERCLDLNTPGRVWAREQPMLSALEGQCSHVHHLADKREFGVRTRGEDFQCSSTYPGLGELDLDGYR